MLDQETWRFINSFAPWLSALGSCAAVITALFLAQRDQHIRLSVRVALSVYLDSCGGPGHGNRLITVKITNNGARAATILPVGWRTGYTIFNHFKFFRLEPIEFVWEHYGGTQLPSKLADGDFALLTFPLEKFSGAIINSMPERALSPWPHLRFRTMRVIVPTTTGKTIYAPVTSEVRKELVRRANAKVSQETV